MTKMAPKWPKSIPTLFCRTYLYSQYKGVPPPPGEFEQLLTIVKKKKTCKNVSSELQQLQHFQYDGNSNSQRRFCWQGISYDYTPMPRREIQRSLPCLRRFANVYLPHVLSRCTYRILVLNYQHLTCFTVENNT